MRPTLRQLEYLIAVAETGRFHAAASKVGVSQPALSSQISDMEAFLGTKLIERRSKGAVLTPAGHEVAKRGRQILRDVTNLNTAVRHSIEPLSGPLKLGVLPSIGAYFLPYVTRVLHAKYPNLRLFVEENGTIALETALQSGDLDILISSSKSTEIVDQMPLFDESLWICAASDHALMSDTSPITIDDLKDETLINIGTGFGLSETIESLAKRAGANVSSEYRGSSLDAARQMAVMGAGLAVLPSLYALSEAARDVDFVMRKIDDPLAIHKVSLIWRSSSPFHDTYKLLAAELLDIKGSLPGPAFQE